MELSDVQSMPSQTLADALGRLGIADDWALGHAVRTSAANSPGDPALGAPGARRNEAFQNLVVGTLTERVFRGRHLSALERSGFDVFDYHENGDNRDYGLRRDGEELPINVKVASTLFRNADSVVGLAPEDCVPISAYKAIGASERVPTLVYVDLVDFSLRTKVDAVMDGLDGDLAVGWHLLSWYAGKGAKRAQDRYINLLFEHRGDELERLVPGPGSFRVISAQRVLAIMRGNPRRVPGLGVKGAGRGTFVAEVNVHVSVASETRAWSDVAAQCQCEGIGSVLTEITRIAQAEVPDPQL